MHAPIPYLALAEDADIDDWLCADALPWEETWDESSLLFESIEPLCVLERMPTEKELRALEAQADDFLEPPENEALAPDDC